MNVLRKHTREFSTEKQRSNENDKSCKITYILYCICIYKNGYKR